MSVHEERTLLLQRISLELMARRSVFAKFGVSNNSWIKNNGKEAVKLFIIASLRIDYIKENIIPKNFYNPFHGHSDTFCWNKVGHNSRGLFVDESMAQFILYQKYFRILSIEELRAVSHGATFLLPFYGECVDNSRILSCEFFREELKFAEDKGVFYSSGDQGCINICPG